MASRNASQPCADAVRGRFRLDGPAREAEKPNRAFEAGRKDCCAMEINMFLQLEREDETKVRSSNELQVR